MSCLDCQNDKMYRLPDDCPFYLGIKDCNKAICLYNILGGCFREGSRNKPYENKEELNDENSI